MRHKKMIHLVDDDDAIRHSASFMLRHAGFQVKTYEDGVAFLDALDEVERGCVLLDVQMPVIDGLGVLEKMNARGVDMPVIVLTGHGDVTVAVEAMKGGAVDFIEKPYEKSVLLDSMSRAFQRLDSRDEREKLEAEAQKRLLALTPREREVLEGLVDGMTNKSIAEQYNISPRTVEIHRANLMHKLETESLSATLRLAFSAGLGFEH
jgi:two-component system response regulator FixJ